MQRIKRWAVPLAAMLIALPVLVTGCGGGGSGYGGGGDYGDDYGNDGYSNDAYDEAYVDQARPDYQNYDDAGEGPLDDYYPDEFDYDGYEPEYP